ncbi:ABC transporter transmembrane domain-containing protein [Dictyobacter kobayashii]|uniref:ABC transmembrane type-1 domain-containing protein n=1 Tax=Dictyobacter kobayashii TaxID=2014872 RepID=A0A402ASH9_9CHLR|nr:ABC transporter transmembrane domain-containing protein [Dictyobacter kobayashii]GCE22078.1 hypothetical protein KDK_58780 [Dictyobacter kobayashii]
MELGEFTVVGAYSYNQASPLQWIVSHLRRYKIYIISFVIGTIMYNVLTSAISLVVGNAFNQIVSVQQRLAALLTSTLVILGIVLARGLIGLLATFTIELLAEYFERDARDELYRGLLNKSQSFHNRQRIGDIMALATNDIRQLNLMINPGVDLIFDALANLIIPLIFIGIIRLDLLLVPLLFVIVFVLSLLDFSRRIGPVYMQLRKQFGQMNAILTETINGIEIVQAAAQEGQEFDKFEQQAQHYRALFIRNGKIQGLYLPPLLLSLAVVGSFIHGVWLYVHGGISLGG